VLTRGMWQRYSLYQPCKDLVREIMHMPKYDDAGAVDPPGVFRPGVNDIVIHNRWVLFRKALMSLEQGRYKG
jgi:hypothetical protein